MNTDDVTACPYCEHMPDRATVKLCDAHACKACERRISAGFEGMCPACAKERVKTALDAERSRQDAVAFATPGPWGLRGSQIRADGGKGAHVATYQIKRADGLLIAAAPEMLEMLLGAISCGEACGGNEGMARDIKLRLARLGLVTLGCDEQGHLSELADLAATVLP